MTLVRKTAEYIIVILTGLLSWWILKEEGYSPWISGLLTLNIALAFMVWNRASAYMKILARVYLGAIFMLSGYVKLVDPMGFMYKFEDYFIAMNLDIMIGSSLFLAFLMSIAELLIGFALFFRIRMKITSVLLILFMLFFLPLTLWLAITNAVTDCGCFGDFLVLSNMQTFFKNMLFMAPVIIVFLNRKGYGWRMRPVYQWITAAVVAGLSLFISLFSYWHLPLHDFRDWKVGTDIAVPEVPDVFLTYANDSTGEQKEWLSADLPWEDSTWISTWSFVSTRTVANMDEESNYFSMQDDDGVDHAADVLLDPEYHLLLVVPDVMTSEWDVFGDINQLYEEATLNDVQMSAVTGSLREDLEPFRHYVQAMYPFYQADDITLKTVIRSNPGLLLLHNGKVLAKWARRDLPVFEEIRDEFLTN